MRHIPVLLDEITEGLMVEPGMTFIDCNLGDGGHSERIIRETKGNVKIVGLDLDPEALVRAKENLEMVVEELYAVGNLSKKPEIHYVKINFRHVVTAVNQISEDLVGKVDAILFDLGLSSYELEESGKGFSFKNDDPLSMTFGEKDEYSFTAEDIVNKWDAEQIEIIIRSYGEERFAGRIARCIVEAREVKPQESDRSGKKNVQGERGIKTARELAEIVRSAYPKLMRFGRTHPATKTFQALRIAVNDELEALQDALPGAISLLKPGGRLAIISYHSLEDRIAKNFFKSISDKIRLVNKKPLTPKSAELQNNPRSRSAKLRIIEKL